ncbi:MAG: YicC family protein [Candidatus Cloacimonetes bacterium]|nr:YicC family protein [Candidatus Cloacimonadota bacterium]
MKSMTGFGKADFFDDRFEITIEIKSVNSRFFDAKFYFPRELFFLENNFKAILNNKINRGKVETRITFNDKQMPELTLDEAKLKSYFALSQKATEILDIKNDISVEKLLKENGVIIAPKSSYENEEIINIFEKTLREALSNHQKMAETEGNSMKLFLADSLKKMKKSIIIIETEFPNQKKKIFQKMNENIEELLQTKLGDESLKRVALEIAFYVEKSDVNEEIIRIRNHFTKFQNELENENIGKKLNFILQEMHREINTIGSKFSTNNVFDDVISVKEEIEKCREMVQNAE